MQNSRPKHLTPIKPINMEPQAQTLCHSLLQSRCVAPGKLQFPGLVSDKPFFSLSFLMVILEGILQSE